MLTGKQRSYLKSLAMELDTAVYIGKAGITETVVREMDDYLRVHELVKVKLQDGALLPPKEAANQTAQQLGAEYVQAIGRRFVLYRQAADIRDRNIVLPR